MIEETNDGAAVINCSCPRLLASAAELRFLDCKLLIHLQFYFPTRVLLDTAMSFSTVTYDTRRAERIADEQREKQEKLAILNNKIAKIDKIKQKHEQLVVDRQKRRLSEMQPPSHIGGYSSFNSASSSPKNSMKASVGTFGSAAKSTATTPKKNAASDSQPSDSPATPTVKKQPRRRTVTIQELEKIQQLVGPNHITVARKAKARASVAVKLNASRRASSFSRLSTGTPVNTNSNGRKQTTAHSFSERKPHNIQSKSAKAVNTVGSSSNGPRRSSALVRRTPKTGITSAKVKRALFLLVETVMLLVGHRHTFPVNCNQISEACPWNPYLEAYQKKYHACKWMMSTD